MGGERFLAAYTLPSPANYMMAKDICQEHNATLPRRTPEQPIASVNSVFMKLSAAYGNYLHIWLDKCIDTDCSIWAVDSYTSTSSHYKYFLATRNGGVSFVICEKGECTMMSFAMCTLFCVELTLAVQLSYADHVITYTAYLCMYASLGWVAFYAVENIPTFICRNYNYDISIFPEVALGKQFEIANGCQLRGGS